MKIAILTAALLAASLSAGAEPLQVIEPIKPASCALTGTRIVGPCAFMAAMLEKMRARCMAAGECRNTCSGEFCPVKL